MDRTALTRPAAPAEPSTLQSRLMVAVALAFVGSAAAGLLLIGGTAHRGSGSLDGASAASSGPLRRQPPPAVEEAAASAAGPETTAAAKPARPAAHTPTYIRIRRPEPEPDPVELALEALRGGL